MPEKSNLSVVLSIEHDQRLDLTADGQVIRGHDIYIREYIGMLESGLMARMGNAAYKVLHALALRARILGDVERPGAEEEYLELERMGMVSAEHKGHLFCFPARECMMQDTGIGSVHTIDAALEELADLKLIQRVTFSQPRRGQGFYGANLYIIHPESFIGKFGSRHGTQTVLAEGANGEQKVLPDRDENGEQKVLPVPGTESSLWNTTNCSLKRQDLLTTTTTREASMNGITRIVEFYRKTIGAEQYGLNERDARELVLLLKGGFSEDQIREGITCAVEHAAQKNRTASFSFCMRSVRHLPSQTREIVAESGKSSMGEIVTYAENAGSATQSGHGSHESGEGKSSAQIVPAFDKSYAQILEGLKLDAGTHEEMEQLLTLVGDHSPRALTKGDARRWNALAEDFRPLALARELRPVQLVQKAVEEALDAGSAREGYVAPKLARAILSRWSRVPRKLDESKPRPPKQEIPRAVQIYREVRRRYPARELWEQIDQTVGSDEKHLIFWRGVLNTWVARGYNPQNVEGPLEWFRQRTVPQRTAVPSPGGWTNQASADDPPLQGTREIDSQNDNRTPSLLGGNGSRRPIERLEVIQHRLRQNAEERKIDRAADDCSTPSGGST